MSRSLYAGLYGFLIVEGTGDPGRYDREVLLAAHHWEGTWVSMQDIRQGPPPDNGLEVSYGSASFNDKTLGHGEPVRVREGERVLFRLLNASATENINLALPRHGFNAPIMLSLGAERSAADLQRAFEDFFLWGIYLRGTVDMLAFASAVWALTDMCSFIKKKCEVGWSGIPSH